MAGSNFKMFVQLLMLVMSSYWIGEVESQGAPHPCPPHQSWTCMKTCHRNCEELSELIAICTQECGFGCECDDGYIFRSKNSKECVRYDECKVTCPPNMHYDPCSLGLEPRCDTLVNAQAIPPPNRCIPQCVCDEGFVFVLKPVPGCIPESDCPVSS